MAHCWYLSDECEYIIVENHETGEKIAAITPEEITTAGENIVVRMKPRADEEAEKRLAAGVKKLDTIGYRDSADGLLVLPMDSEERFDRAQEIILKTMKKTAAVLDAIPDEGLNDRLEWLGHCSEIMLRLSEAMKNVDV